MFEERFQTLLRILTPFASRSMSGLANFASSSATSSSCSLTSASSSSVWRYENLRLGLSSGRESFRERCCFFGARPSFITAAGSRNSNFRSRVSRLTRHPITKLTTNTVAVHSLVRTSEYRVGRILCQPFGLQPRIINHTAKGWAGAEVSSRV
jgi:hypothetical protein